ncbi:SDR family NAD(P)-dependent oxidoreductase [uncultured Nocardioides sp.]|uniref:SDR family NAD(P)-dependent oxidoreductase n=1 Tax=uncultured Nocardioides sp. TaxID=198441 RepID=UPI002638246A|nr:SDR family NAD(P)-dependent oxidoreductase [uncultured Nocardioides sp.]
MEQRSWIITGASSGLGRALTEAALAAGDTVVAAMRRPERIDDLLDAYPRTILPVAFDVRGTAEASGLIGAAIDRFGPVFAQYYGQSEAPMVITYLSKEDHAEAVASGNDARLSSCGRPAAMLRTALLGEDGSPVPVGEPGEICVAGPLLSGGYWKLPEVTAETFRDGWMHTGDVAREDEDGFWYIVDRTKDMIVTGGFNVFPREVEDVVAEHPAIAQVGVIGTPHEKFGEAVTAVVVMREGHELTEAVVSEIQEMVKDRKGSVQAPKQVIATDALPLTGLGKPDKKALRAQFWTGDRSVG